ncbi:MAG: hypothetical protein NW207_03595 [Cytophagales bacterium]|nr:hypothetical protein [Cytophagales bacterium]
MSIIKYIQQHCPQAYKELMQYISTHHAEILIPHKLSPDDLPDIFLIGLIFSFFQANNIDFSVGSPNIQPLIEDIKTTFDEYEKMTSHFS